MNAPKSGLDEFPDYLKSYDALVQHLRAQLEDLSSTEKGKRFARFTQRLLPLTQVGLNFESPTLSAKESVDEGVDLSAEGKGKAAVLYIQARLWIDRADDIDSILSKFQSYLSRYHQAGKNQQYRLPLNEQAAHFSIVTAANLGGIIKSYKSKSYASRPFFDELENNKKITLIDGAIVFGTLRAAFTKHSSPPSSLTLTLDSVPVCKQNVRIGIISSTQLKQLYSEFAIHYFLKTYATSWALLRHLSAKEGARQIQRSLRR